MKDPQYLRRQGLATIEIDGEVSIFNGVDRTLLLNSTASVIWETLDEASTAAAIADALAPRYGTTPEDIRPSIEDALDQLVEFGVVDVADC